MPRPRLYKDNAEKQAAYRERHADRLPVRESLLAAQARSLHRAVSEAVRAKKSVLPPELLGRRADQTLQNLIHYLQSAGLQRQESSASLEAEGDQKSDHESSKDK